MALQNIKLSVIEYLEDAENYFEEGGLKYAEDIEELNEICKKEPILSHEIEDAEHAVELLGEVKKFISLTIADLKNKKRK